MSIDSLINRLLVETRYNSFLVRSEYKNGRKVFVFHGVDGNAPPGFAAKAQDWFAAQGIQAHCEGNDGRASGDPEVETADGEVKARSQVHWFLRQIRPVPGFPAEEQVHRREHHSHAV